jgi:ABC-2 type transport system ATP-binding protein
MIRLNNLQKEYKGFMLNVTMDIPEGRVTGLIGRN